MHVTCEICIKDNNCLYNISRISTRIFTVNYWYVQITEEICNKVNDCCMPSDARGQRIHYEVIMSLKEYTTVSAVKTRYCQPIVGCWSGEKSITYLWLVSGFICLWIHLAILVLLYQWVGNCTLRLRRKLYVHIHKDFKWLVFDLQ